MKRRHFWIGLVLMISTLGLWSGLITAGRMADHWGEQMRFQVVYSSSWYPYYRGIYINDAGEIYGFLRDDWGQQPWMQPRQPLSVFVLHSGWYYFKTEQIGQVAPQELAAMTAQIEQIDPGARSQAASWCMDSGQLLYQAFDSRAEPIFLEREGDVYQYNPSPAAAALFEWLKTQQQGTDYASDMGTCGPEGRTDLEYWFEE